MTIELTDNEVWLMLGVLEAHSANVKLKAASGKWNRDKAQHYCKKMCDLSSKLYQRQVQIDMNKARAGE